MRCRFNSREDNIAFHEKLEYVHLPYVTTYPMGIGSNYLHSKGARVVFTGHTGDEGVSHRARRYELFHNREYPAYFKLYQQDLKGKPFSLLRGIRAGLADAKEYRRNLTAIPEESRFYPELLDRAFSQRLRKSYREPYFTFQFDPVTYVNQGGSRARFEIAAYHGSFNDIQYLFPYADYRVLDYAMSIPRRLYLSRTQSRVIFRETFQDIMPQELKAVDYKQTASFEQRKRSDDYDESFLENVSRIQSELDHSVWDGILNFDQISSIKPSGDRKESAYNILHLSYLVRCIRIQRMQSDCKEWRKMDERDKETL
jgi:asparagine synthase (glutamine-hydrolysing)